MLTETIPASIRSATRAACPGPLGVGGHQVGAEAERGLVCQGDRLVLGAGPVDLRDRAEELFLGGLVARLDPGQDRRFEVVAVALAADQDLSAVLDRAPDLVL